MSFCLPVQVSADGQAALAIQASLLLRSIVQAILDVSGYFDEQCDAPAAGTAPTSQ